MWEVTTYLDAYLACDPASVTRHTTLRVALADARRLVSAHRGTQHTFVSCESEDGHTGCTWSSDLGAWAWYVDSAKARTDWATYLAKERTIITNAPTIPDVIEVALQIEVE